MCIMCDVACVVSSWWCVGLCVVCAMLCMECCVHNLVLDMRWVVLYIVRGA